MSPSVSMPRRSRLATHLCSRWFWYALTGLATAGCSQGTMTLQEVHYFAPTNESNTNYFRLRVFAETELGVSQYRSGWFPASSVDRLFGQVDDAGGIKALATRIVIESLISAKVEDTYKKWLEQAADPSVTQQELENLLNARRRVLAYPLSGLPPFPGTIEAEFNPARGVALRRSDEKLVFMLSSNPDDVIGKIANFSESDRTALTINRLGTLMANRSRADLVAKETANRVRSEMDATTVRRLEAVGAAAATAGAGGATDLAPVLTEVQSLIVFLEGSQP